MTSMKIALMCAAEIFPKEFGGAEKTVGYRARELDKLGYDLTLFSLGPYKPKNNKWVRWTGNAKEVLVDEYDVIDNNGPTKFPCDHVITTIQGPFYPKRNVVTISHSQAKGMGFYPNYRCVHYGTDTDFYHPAYDKKEDWFLYFSRIVHGKGPHIAIQLAKEMEFELKVVGEDKKYVEPLYVAQIKKMCKEIPNVEYLGPKYNEDAVWYLQRAKAMLFPQFWGEAFGLVMIESLACGTPVIAGGTNGAPPEVIKHGETGFLCKSYEDYKEAIRNIDQINPKTCRKDAEKIWSARRMTEDYIRLYEAVAGGKTW